MRIATKLCLSLMLLAAAGCNFPGQIHWSLDGKRAAYLPAFGETALVIDADGRILSRLGKSLGGFAWSADSATLYYSAASKDAAAPVAEEHNQWLMKSDMNAKKRKAKLDFDDDDIARFAVSAWRDGKSESLLSTDRFAPLFMELSPDGRWLCFSAAVGPDNRKPNADDDDKTDDADQNFMLYALNVKSKRLYALSDACMFGFCFTGPSRIAHVQFQGTLPGNRAEGEIDVCANDDDKPAAPIPAKLIETVLPADEAADPRRTELTDALGFVGAWITRVGDGGDDLLLAAPKTPGGLEEEGDLYRFRRGNGKLEPLARKVRFLSRSPDGRRALLAREDDRPAGHDGDDHTLVLLDVETGKTTDLRPMGPPAFWPAWRGNDQITFIPPERPTDAAPAPKRIVNDKGEVTLHFDLVLYDLAPDKPVLKLARVLSGAWDLADKPRQNAGKDAVREPRP